MKKRGGSKYSINFYDYTFYDGRRLYRIVANRDIKTKGVKKGDKGGYVKNYSNLSQEGDAWICDGAIAYKDALVSGNSLVGGFSVLTDRCKIFGNATILGSTIVGGTSKIYGNALLKDNVRLLGDAEIFGNAIINGNSVIKSGKHIGSFNYSDIIKTLKKL